MIGIIGGSGVTLELEGAREIIVHTPYGEPSSSVTIGKLAGKEVAVLLRHGKGHIIPPHKVNYRSNIFALKSVGVGAILALCSAGSLKEEIKPGEFVLVDQFIDRTNGRKSSFYESQRVCHISMGEPICPNIREQLGKLSRDLNIQTHPKGVYVCVNGPRFSSKAESNLFRSWGCDIVGMTLVPECVLAREAEICYAGIAMISDYDCWRDRTVNITDMLSVIRDSVSDAKRLVAAAVENIELDPNCACRSALKDAFVN